MAAVHTLESLESRFADLQRRILGESATLDERKSGDTVADLLTDAGASIRAALSGRDKVASLAPRMAELERYLDPTFEDSLDASATVEAILSAEPALREREEQLRRLIELSPVLDSKAMAGVAEHGDRIERLAFVNLESHEHSRECCDRVYALVEDYNALVVNVTKTLVQCDDAVTRLELEGRPKKVVE